MASCIVWPIDPKAYFEPHRQDLLSDLASTAKAGITPSHAWALPPPATPARSAHRIDLRTSGTLAGTAGPLRLLTLPPDLLTQRIGLPVPEPLVYGNGIVPPRLNAIDHIPLYRIRDRVAGTSLQLCSLHR